MATKEIDKLIKGGIYEIKPQNDDVFLSLTNAVIVKKDRARELVWVLPCSLTNGSFMFRADRIACISELNDFIEKIGDVDKKTFKDIEVIAKDLIERLDKHLLEIAQRLEKQNIEDGTIHEVKQYTTHYDPRIGFVVDRCEIIG